MISANNILVTPVSKLIAYLKRKGNSHHRHLTFPGVALNRCRKLTKRQIISDVFIKDDYSYSTIGLSSA